MSPALLYYAIPVFAVLFSLEAWFSWKENRQLYELKDTLSSLAMGIGNVLSGLVTKAFIFALFSLLYRFRLFTLDGTHWWHWAVAFLADDFSYYWFHRSSHHINWFWASHVVHHSSEKYNLAAALRQTWTGNITGAFLFWCWMPLVGFHPVVVLIMQSISLIYQFWIHTEIIYKFPGPVEFFFNTPSHHRVHHGINLKYLDKNHAGVLIIWDRIFGTFQKEEEHPKYGLTRNIGSFNPVMIAFGTWADLVKKVRRARSLKVAILYFIKPPGWSHDGTSLTTRELIEEYDRRHPDKPVHKIKKTIPN